MKSTTAQMIPALIQSFIPQSFHSLIHDHVSFISFIFTPYVSNVVIILAVAKAAPKSESFSINVCKSLVDLPAKTSDAVLSPSAYCANTSLNFGPNNADELFSNDFAVGIVTGKQNGVGSFSR